MLRSCEWNGARISWNSSCSTFPSAISDERISSSMPSSVSKVPLTAAERSSAARRKTFSMVWDSHQRTTKKTASENPAPMQITHATAK